MKKRQAVEEVELKGRRGGVEDELKGVQPLIDQVRVCVRVCVSVCVHVSVYVCISVSVYVCASVCWCVYVYVYLGRGAVGCVCCVDVNIHNVCVTCFSYVNLYP